MSLLIKALDKAENDKSVIDMSVNDKIEHSNIKTQAEKSKAKGLASQDLKLSLSPTNSHPAQPVIANKPSTSAAKQNTRDSAPSLASSTASASSAPATSASHKSAANVFSAKGVEANNRNTSLALIAGAGLLALLVMGIYFYQFVDTTPDVLIPPRLPEQLPEQLEVQLQIQAQTQAPAQIQTQAQKQVPEQLSEQLPESSATLPQIPVTETPPPQAFEPDETVQLAEQQQAPALPVKKMVKRQATRDSEVEVVVGESASDVMLVETNEAIVPVKANKKARKSTSLPFGEPIASPSASINVSKTKSEAAGVNPVLMSAYEAYNAGDDAKAQKLYKQVLQRDVRNVDALLGLGAIASRQGRVADANGWFAKVLELDPRNSMAQAALLDTQPQGNEANSESRIKNMLAKNPNDANLHVALGNLYAEQSQWPAAQQAYFDAYSLNGSADNTFNLAVSLDQMGKPKLALPYYQRALAQASSASSIDKAALEARIAAIQ